MIHAFALEPKLVATWGKREEYRFVCDKFGLGTPRALLELPAFRKWKRDVYLAANELALSQKEMTRIEELFKLFGDHKCRRTDSVYNGLLTWLENAESEYDRRPFGAIVAAQNPREHQGVLVSGQLDERGAQWACEVGAPPARTAEALAGVLSPMLINCKTLHLVDPYWNPAEPRYSKVLEALMDVLVTHALSPELIRVHCSDKLALALFEKAATEMAARLPKGCTIEFARWKEREGGEKLHNRYVLTDLGGVSLGIGLDAGKAGQTDDLVLLPRALYLHRWLQYVKDDGSFESADKPTSVRGARAPRGSRGFG